MAETPTLAMPEFEPAMWRGSSTSSPLTHLLELTQSIERLYALFGSLDTTSEEEYIQRLRSFDSSMQGPLKDFFQNLAKEGKPPRWYLNVAGRLVWLNAVYPNATILPFPIHWNPYRELLKPKYDGKGTVTGYTHHYGESRCGCLIFDGRGRVGYGEKSETALDFPDYYEKSLTGAIGRACFCLGIGTQFAGNELDEGQRIVDSPQAMSNLTPNVLSSAANNGVAIPASTAVQTVDKDGFKALADMMGKGAVSPSSAPSSLKRQQATPAPVAQPSLPVTSGADQRLQKPLPTTIEACQKEITWLKMEKFGNYERPVMFQHVCRTRQLPDDEHTWKLEQYQKAVEGIREWLTNPEKSKEWCALAPLAKMQERITLYVKAYGHMLLNRFSMQTFKDNKKGYGNLKRGEMDELLTALDQSAVDVAVAKEVDFDGKTFKLLSEMCSEGVTHPLDLLNAERIDDWKMYMSKIRHKVQTGQVTLPDQLRETYKEDLDRFLATPLFSKERDTVAK